MKFFAFLLTAVIAAPFDNAKWVNSRYTSRVAVHESCNPVQRIQLEKALDDYERLVHNANDYLLRSGPEDELTIKYFGTDSQAQNQVVAAGIYDNLSRGDKYGATLRCDDPDSLCAQIPTYAGHHRGTNGTLETVICDLSYETRKPIEQVCALGHRVPDDNASKFWGIDFIHRFSHLPIVAGGNVGHTADDFDSLIDLAKNNASASAWNMKTLQYYALDAWAHTFANPGVGCDEEEASQPAPAQPSPTADAPVSCHTHANGEEHCSSDG
ncbi:major allergen Asp f 2-like protein [Wallemia mellicola]|uniref:Major allergen Asp f 2-like protein n=1 Tax=Wallemia mellicola TaxID=1708541 RepID=A0AB38MWQ5_9BASI|nr:hypothetical protein E3Q24_01395 [Wallemia mellicola]TIB87085.1 major allergen Asp f 2-like protein [Wallemia mellicola]TIB90122.1 major allergen Asp f 2-like protein [Wallemia mellicola]TIC06073.1 major allergen Asp f 2-like protein [Wallemia mellicola]TIC21404.1 major allergen Asp f 2-like protein [Wallemia mellicola]